MIDRAGFHVRTSAPAIATAIAEVRSQIAEVKARSQVPNPACRCRRLGLFGSAQPRSGERCSSRASQGSIGNGQASKERKKWFGAKTVPAPPHLDVRLQLNLPSMNAKTLHKL